MEKIGILGGSGAKSTAFLYNRVLDICVSDYNATRDQDYPYLVIYNSPLQKLNEQGESSSNFLPLLIEQVLEMETIGCTTIVMACNTLHQFFHDIKKHLNPTTNFVSMLDLTLLELNKLKYRQISVLCSEKSAHIKLHDSAWQNYQIHYCHDQLKINQIIDNIIKNKTSDCERQLMSLLREISWAHDLPKERIIVISCTELSVVYSRLRKLIFNQTILDTGEVLAQYIAKISYQTSTL